MRSEMAAKVVVVTGASRGIGREIACAFAEEGARVAALGRTAGDLDESVRLARERGGEADAWTCDVTDPEQVEATIDGIAAELGGLDVVVNNAGQRQNFRTIDELSIEEWRRVIEANLSSVFFVSQAAARRMLAAGGGGSIVNIASIAGPVAFPRIGAYCAAKAGVIALTKVMATEWAPQGIRVNAVAPGWIESPMNLELRTEPRNQELLESIKGRILLARFGASPEVASAAVFLAGAAATYITGETLYVDGGWTTI
ncbi:MAG: SDR family NAD(P)-dependent oxidoreductase [Acidimicrobiia bacterium]